MIALQIPTTTMAVIDSDRAGYDALTNSQRVSWRFLSSGREALRLAAAERIAVWWIGVDLPDMGGFDLYDMLRQRFEGATVCMVGRAYRVEDDLLARRAGAAMYVCKPVDTCWLPWPARRRQDGELNIQSKHEPFGIYDRRFTEPERMN